MGESMIVCGWCEHPTPADADCRNCDHEDPGRPWRQRGREAPTVRTDAAGRPTLDARTIRRQLAAARASLGAEATQAELAEHLDISVRTLGRWQKVAD